MKQARSRHASRMDAVAVSPLQVFALIVAVVLVSATALDGQVFSVVYNFGTVKNGPVFPSYPGIIAQGRNGDLYSSTPSSTCGTQYCGTGAAYRVTTGGKVKVIHLFEQTEDQPAAVSGVTLGSDGNFYGSTPYFGYGNSWKMTPAGKVTDFNVFGGAGGLSQPYAPPVEGMDGNYYGTANTGGMQSDSCGEINCGGIYKIESSGNGYSVLHELVGTDGSNPIGPLLLGTDGNFYGTTYSGGSSIYGGAGGAGVIFTITPSGSYSVLYNFCSQANCADGEYPLDGLVQGTDGNFYGTTTSGGANTGFAQGGVVFRISPAGEYTVLYTFCSQVNCADGNGPYGGLVQASDGNFYGTTSAGGASTYYGNIFQITPSGQYIVLYNFDSTASFPLVTPVQHTNGLLYGDTSSGGTHGFGVFFSLDMGLPPFAKLVTWWGSVGSTVEILGQGFTGASSVSFNGTAAKFKVTGDTCLKAKVPKGATSGSVTVVTPSGTLTSSQVFQVQ